MPTSEDHDRRSHRVGIFQAVCALLAIVVGLLAWLLPQQPSGTETSPDSSVPTSSPGGTSPDDVEGDVDPPRDTETSAPDDGSFGSFVDGVVPTVRTFGIGWNWWQLLLWWLPIAAATVFALVKANRRDGGLGPVYGFYLVMVLIYTVVFEPSLTAWGFGLLWGPVALVGLLTVLDADPPEQNR